MTERMDHESQIAAYLAGRLSAEEAQAFERACAHDGELCRDVEDLRGTVRWVKDAAAQSSRTEFRLSPERQSRIVAEIREDIVRFPGKAPVRAARVGSGPARYAFRRGVAACAAAVAMVVGGFVGLEAGKHRFDAQVKDLRASLDVSVADTQIEYPERVHYYPPAYGLDHADALRISGGRGTAELGLVNDYDLPVVGYAVDAPPHYGLAGPRPPYLSERAIDTQP